MKPHKERRKELINRIRLLRNMKVPEWVVRSEQVALVLCRKRMKYYGIGKTPTKTQGDLMEKYVLPLMGQGDFE